jgi:hypothetical protein
VILDETNSIDLVDNDDELVVDDSDPPAWTIDELLEFLPSWAREAEAPIRDALLEAVRAMAQLLWARIGHLAGQLRSPRFAEGVWLDAWGELKRIPKQPNESEADYRARLLALPDGITPKAIRTALEQIRVEFTLLPVVALEPSIDIMFAAPLDSPWFCFAQPVDRRLWGEDPERPGATWGAYTFDLLGTSQAGYARFVIIVAEDAGATDPLAYAMADTLTEESFAAPAADAYAFVFRGLDSLMERLEGSAEQQRAGGVVVLEFTDAGLVLAR